MRPAGSPVSARIVPIAIREGISFYANVMSAPHGCIADDFTGATDLGKVNDRKGTRPLARSPGSAVSPAALLRRAR